MATLAGEVTQVVGTVIAVDEAGNERTLSAGDQVFAGETIKTGDDGYVAINLVDGGRFDLGRSGEAVLDSDVVSVEPEPAPPAGDETALSVESIQAAIAAGVDPTQLLPATAAGPAAGGPGGGPDGAGHSFVIVPPGLAESLPGVPDFATQGFGVNFGDLPGTREDVFEEASTVTSPTSPTTVTSATTPTTVTSATTPTTVTSATTPTTATTPSDPLGNAISDVVFYVVDAEGNLTTVKLDYSPQLELKDARQPGDLVDEVESLLGDEAGDVVGYTIKGGNDYTHVLVNDGTLTEVDADTLQALVDDPNGVENNRQTDFEGSYNGSSVTIDGVGTIEASSELTFSGLFGSESLFGEGEGSGGGHGGGNGGGHGNPNQPDLGNLVDGGDGSDS